MNSTTRQPMKSTDKFTAAQLATLRAEYANTPERLSMESIEKLRAVVVGFSDAALAQVLLGERIRWIYTLACTEIRVRGLSHAKLIELYHN